MIIFMRMIVVLILFFSYLSANAAECKSADIRLNHNREHVATKKISTETVLRQETRLIVKSIADVSTYTTESDSFPHLSIRFNTAWAELTYSDSKVKIEKTEHYAGGMNRGIVTGAIAGAFSLPFAVADSALSLFKGKSPKETFQKHGFLACDIVTEIIQKIKGPLTKVALFPPEKNHTRRMLPRELSVYVDSPNEREAPLFLKRFNDAWLPVGDNQYNVKIALDYLNSDGIQALKGEGLSKIQIILSPYDFDLGDFASSVGLNSDEISAPFLAEVDLGEFKQVAFREARERYPNGQKVEKWARVTEAENSFKRTEKTAAVSAFPDSPSDQISSFPNYSGTYFYANGDKYVGAFKDDKRHGQGTVTYANGDKYVGAFKDDKRHGQGTVTYANGDKYVGAFKDDKRHGQGTVTYANGDKYVGAFKDDKRHGQGTYIVNEADRPPNRYFSASKVQEGVWKDNVFQYAQKVEKSGNNYAEASKSDTTSKELKTLKRQVDQDKGKRRELERQLTLLKKEKEQQSETLAKSEPKSEFPNQPINVSFKAITKKPDDIAVIIGNANYKKMGKDIPNVNPAYADAEGIKRYFMRAKGIREGNIIYLKDATGSQLASVFGNTNSHKARLYNWVKPQVSNVYVYYAGHGVPGGDKGNAYLVPTDADSQTIQFSGYPLSTLYSNLGKLPAKSITVILEACFSGASQAGNLFANSSPIVITAKKTRIPKNIKVISAGAVDQMASWEKDKSHGLFTKYFLKAMSGEGDKNKDGRVSDTELKNYLGETMTYYARRYYGRDQNVQIVNGN